VIGSLVSDFRLTHLGAEPRIDPTVSHGNPAILTS